MTATPTLRHVRDLQIEWGQCDPAGIVFHPRYLEIFDACAALLFQHASGMTKAEMLRRYDAVGIPWWKRVPSSPGLAAMATPCGSLVG